MAQEPSAADVLSQSEVEAILASIQTGVDPSAKVVTTTSSGMGGDGGAYTSSGEGHQVQPFDFRSPVFLTPAQMRRLRIKHEEFIRNLGATLSVFLRMEFLLQMSRLETTTYRQLVESMTMPSYLTLFRMKPLTGIGVLDISPRLGLTVIDRMLGGPGHSVKVEREFTDMEQTVLENFIKVIIKEYTESWLRFQKLEWEKVGNENTVRFLNLADEDATMLYLEIEARFGDCVASMRFIFSYTMIESLVEQLMREITDDRSYEEETKQKLPEDMNSPTYNISIPVSAHWRGFTVSLADISELAVGDVLMLDPNKTRKAEVDLGLLPKFYADVNAIPGVTAPPGTQAAVTLSNKIE